MRSYSTDSTSIRNADINRTISKLLQIREDTLTFSKIICDVCGGTSTSIFELDNSSQITDDEKENNRTLMTTVDMFGNVFQVNHDGRTSLKNCDDARDSSSSEMTDDNLEECSKEKKRRVTQRNMEKGEHSNLCLPAGYPLRSRYRIFAMNRDLTAYEYHHRSEWLQQEKTVFLNDESSFISHAIPRRPDLEYRLTFVPLKPLTASRKWLQPHKAIYEFFLYYPSSRIG